MFWPLEALLRATPLEDILLLCQIRLTSISCRYLQTVTTSFIRSLLRHGQHYQLEINFCHFTLWGDGSSISMPKLEEGQTATGFVVHENDLKASTLRPCGLWNASTTYENNRLYIDVVSHNGQYYSCKKTNVGQTPSANSPFWGISNKMKFVATDLIACRKCLY